MVRRIDLVRAAALGVLACGGLVQGSELGASRVGAGVDGASEMRLDKPLYLQEEDKGRRPLMATAERVGFAPLLDDLGIDISGHVELGYTWSFENPPGDVIGGRVFDVEHDELLLHQVDVTVQRTLTPDDNEVTGYADKFNIGFNMEWIYGQDARFIHANGLFDHYVDDASRNEEFDLTQAYVTVGLPVGNGLLITAGKFVTLIGYEYINPTLNPLYSRSYLFGYAIPFTHTGVMAKYNFTEELSVTGGVVRGWEQALEDNNEAESFIAQVAYTWNPGGGDSEPVNIALTGITGPEREDNEGDYRTLLDLIISTKIGDQVTVGLNADWAYEENAALADDFTADGDDAQWYGVAAYAQYKINDQFTINGRAEWFNDKDNARGIGTNIYEATIGLAIKPFPNNELGANVTIRPEVRYDYAQEAFFDGGTEHSQLTAGADVIFTF